MTPPTLLLALVLACAGTARAAPLVVDVVDAAGKPLEGAVVTVTVAGAPRSAPPQASAQIVQQNRQFAPRLSVVQVGTAVSFPNVDTVRHHVYSFSPAKTFELKLYAGTPPQQIVFDKPGTAVLGCNIHDRMSAWVVVVETPHFGLTDASGRVRLDVPDGEHLLRAWLGRAETPVPVERRVRAGSTSTVTLTAAGGAG